MLAGGFRHMAILAFAHGGVEEGGRNMSVVLCWAQLLHTLLFFIRVTDILW